MYVFLSPQVVTVLFDLPLPLRNLSHHVSVLESPLQAHPDPRPPPPWVTSKLLTP